MSDNAVTIVGNVTRDPELRFTSSGQAATSFGLAVNRRWRNRQTQAGKSCVTSGRLGDAKVIRVGHVQPTTEPKDPYLFPPSGVA